MLLCFWGFGQPAIAQQLTELTQAPVSNSLFEALTQGQTKALFRYSGQRRNSNLHVLQDGSAPDVSDEKLQY